MRLLRTRVLNEKLSIAYPENSVLLLSPAFSQAVLS
ncbi:MAG: hypothetical protein QOH85_1540 [Acidobacteriaceae bacterium]|jgi:hypothetical protein|nr:hypothetical protein [Acidobacteriaceae bacterium]